MPDSFNTTRYWERFKAADDPAHLFYTFLIKYNNAQNL
jgi:hypothetical protein